MTARRSGWARKRKDTAAELARDARYRTPEYRAAERALRTAVEAGRGLCWRCGGWIDPSARVWRGRRGWMRAWHVGHDDRDPSVIRGAEHERCNLRAAARAGARKRNGGGGATKVRL